MINPFMYVSFLFATLGALFLALMVPAIKKLPGFKKMFKNGWDYWTWRLYMEDVRARDESTYRLLTILPNVLWIVPMLIGLLYKWGFFA